MHSISQNTTTPSFTLFIFLKLLRKSRLTPTSVEIKFVNTQWYCHFEIKPVIQKAIWEKQKSLVIKNKPKTRWKVSFDFFHILKYQAVSALQLIRRKRNRTG